VKSIAEREAFLISLALGFTVRLIPEVLSYPYLTNSDTAYYTARIKTGVIWSKRALRLQCGYSTPILTRVNQLLRSARGLIAVHKLLHSGFRYSRSVVWRVDLMIKNVNLGRFQKLRTSLNCHKSLILSFLLGFMVRLVPEVLSYPYPIGFDTIFYAARISDGVIWYHWTSLFSTWLLYAFLIPLNGILKNPFLLLKLASPFIFGLNSSGIYYFATSALGWNSRKGLMTSFFFAFSMASLGLSWHFHKNMLGLAILLFALPSIVKIDTKRSYLWSFWLSVLVVFSHEYASVIMFAVVFAWLGNHLLKKEKRDSLKLLIAISFTFSVFLISIYLMLFPVPSNIKSNIVYADDAVYAHPAGLFFMVDYLRVELPFMHYSTYLGLVSHVVSLFSLLYLAWLPLVFIGFFRNQVLDIWLIILLIGSFDALITPFFALNFWYRWMLMIVYPFVFYAVNGVGRVWQSRSAIAVSGNKWLRWMKVSKRSVLGILLLTVLLGSIFMATPLLFDRYGVFSIPTTWSYIPSTMLYNSIPFRDVDGLLQVFKWLNSYMYDHSAVLLQQCIVSWADIYLDKRYTIVFYQIDVEKAIEVARNDDFDPIYLVWWNQDIGWYGITVPDRDFISVFSYDRMSVFVFSG